MRPDSRGGRGRAGSGAVCLGGHVTDTDRDHRLGLQPWSGSATVGGTVNSNGEKAATYHFDYGTSSNYTSQTVSEPIVDTTPELVDAALTGLSTNTVYHYRIEATAANVGNELRG